MPTVMPEDADHTDARRSAVLTVPGPVHCLACGARVGDADATVTLGASRCPRCGSVLEQPGTSAEAERALASVRREAANRQWVWAGAVLATVVAGALLWWSLRGESTPEWRELQAFASEFTGIPVPAEGITLQGATPERLRAVIAADLDREIPPERLAAMERVYKAIGLLEPDVDLRQTLLDMYSAEVVGLYRPREEVLLLRGDTEGDVDLARLDRHDRAIVVHELTHALQATRADLVEYTREGPDGERLPRNEDERAAMIALLEGQATAAQMDYLYRQRGLGSIAAREWDELGDDLRALDHTAERYPAFLGTSLVYPYTVGTRYVHRLLAQGVTPAEMLEARIPDSTEQLARSRFEGTIAGQPDAPTPVDLVTLRTWLGQEHRILFDEVMGHFTLAHVCGTEECNWDGDRLIAAERLDGGGLVLAWWIVTDGPPEPSRGNPLRALADYAHRDGATEVLDQQEAELRWRMGTRQAGWIEYVERADDQGVFLRAPSWDTLATLRGRLAAMDGVNLPALDLSTLTPETGE